MNDTLQLTPHQLEFFETFGFLKIPGLFADDIDRITEAFEDVFANNQTWDTNEELHFGDRRRIIAAVIDKSPVLSGLLTDSRVTGIVGSLMGDTWEYAESDGNLFDCDTSWHADTYSAPMTQFHVKLSFYLDELTAESGAIRLIPGTNFFNSPFARFVRSRTDTPDLVRQHFGLDPNEIPSWPLASTPGDLIVWNFRTVHASFGGSMRRRLFSINFRRPVPPPAETAEGTPAPD